MQKQNEIMSSEMSNCVSFASCQPKGRWKSKEKFLWIKTNASQSSFRTEAKLGSGGFFVSKTSHNYFKIQSEPAYRTGRFECVSIGECPIHSQDYNRYTYVNNNPLRFTDPSGYIHQGWDSHYQTHRNIAVQWANSHGAWNDQFESNKSHFLYIDYWSSSAHGGMGGGLSLEDFGLSELVLSDASVALFNDFLSNTGIQITGQSNQGIELTLAWFEGHKGGVTANGNGWMAQTAQTFAFRKVFLGYGDNTGDNFGKTTNDINTVLGVVTGVFAGNYGLTSKQVFRYAERINRQLVSASQLTKIHYLHSMKVASFLGRINFVTGTIGTVYSANRAIEDYRKGGWEQVSGWDALDAAVGAGGVTAGSLAMFGIISNPVGWCVGIGVGIYFGGRLIYDLSTSN